MTNPKLSHTVDLDIPLAVTKAGAAVSVQALTLTRPKTRHVKQLAILVGAELLSALMGSDDAVAGADKVDMTRLIADVAPLLFSEERLNGFQALIADLAGISAAEVGEIDPIDFLKLLGGFASFFPALQSIASKSFPQI